MPMFKLPRFYAILDAETALRRGVGVEDCARGMRAAGVTLIQYRDKRGGPQEILRAVEMLRGIFDGAECRVILNDRADWAVLAGVGGVHLGQADMRPADARRVVGAGAIIGHSTHNEEQVLAEAAGEADYLAIGPVYATGTKENPDPVVGLEGVRAARALTTKPLVAIGGITLERAAEVLAAGADSVAVISAAMGGTAAETERLCAEWVRLLG